MPHCIMGVYKGDTLGNGDGIYGAHYGALISPLLGYLDIPYSRISRIFRIISRARAKVQRP